MKMKKEKRLEAINELITRFPVEDQEQLVNLLKRHYKIETNQSIVSRDLRELGVIKRVRDKLLVYEPVEVETTKEILYRAILDIEFNETTIVVHTLGGLADFVGDYLDTQESDELLGTLSGENIVLVIPKSVKNIAATYNTVCKLLHYKKQGSKL